MYLILKLSMIAAAAIGQTGENSSNASSNNNTMVTRPALVQNQQALAANTGVEQADNDSVIVLLDSYFNNETKKNKSGNIVSNHYKWEQKDYGGYSLWGAVFNDAGAATKTTYDPPSKKVLINASIYIITDPDIPKENKEAKYMTKGYAEAVANWVSKGGVLVMMANDSGNADIEHFNLLAQQFGFQFNNDSYNRVPGRSFDPGGIVVPEGNAIFQKSRLVYIKELATIKVLKPAQTKTILEKEGHIIAITTHYGKGTVFAVGDPWFYNEYVDGKRLPAKFENIGAMKEFTKWLIQKAGK